MRQSSKWSVLCLIGGVAVWAGGASGAPLAAQSHAVASVTIEAKEVQMLERVNRKLAAGQPVTIVAYGDSISECDRSPNWFGGAKTRDGWWGNQLEQMLRKAFPKADLKVKSFGIGGQNAYEGLGRVDWIADLKPDLVLLAFGANDCGWHDIPPSATATALTRLVEVLRAQFQVDIVILGFAGDNPLKPAMAHEEETAAAIRKVAEATKTPWVDIRAAILKATNQGKDWEQCHNGPQDCHPNDKGHAVWAETVMEALKRHIKVF